MKSAHVPLARDLIAGLLHVAKLGKMKGIYHGIRPSPLDGAVHSFQNPAGTETTRFSHSGTWLFEPGSYNLATLPKKTAMENPLYRVRDCIIPHEGRLLGAADYSQAEARWCAWMAQDSVRIGLYERRIDHYKWFVALLKWEDASRWREVSKAERDSIGKVGVLSGQYQVGWKTLMDGVNGDFELHGVSINAKTAKAMVDIWPNAMPKTVEWWKTTAMEALETGFTINPFGRKRIYFGRKDSESARLAVVREAIADGPQSANAMAINRAIRTLYERHDPDCPPQQAQEGEKFLRILMNVHDEVLFDFKPRDMRKVTKAVKDVMEQPFEVEGRRLVIPAEVNVTSTNWGDMKEVA